MKVVAVVLNWRLPKETAACVASLRATAPDVEVIVVDNASGDGSPEELASAFPGITVLRNEANLGYAGGNNRGIEAALARGADAVLVLNNDVVVRPGCIDALVDELATREVGITAPVSLRPGTPAVVDFYRATVDLANMALLAHGRDERWWGATEPDDTDYATGSALLLDAAAVRALGAFDERYFMVWEDVDLCLRIARASLRVRVVPRAEVVHAGSTSFGPDGASSPVYRYLFVRNSFLIARSHLRWPWRARAVRTLQRRYSGWADGDTPAHAAIARGLEDGLAGRFGPPPPDLLPVAG